MVDNHRLEELIFSVKNFCEDREWTPFHNPKDLAIALSIEASELLELFRFKSNEEISELLVSEKKELVADEVADILFFLLRFADLNDIDLSTALQKKLVKNAEKYPIDKAKGSNKKYTEL